VNGVSEGGEGKTKLEKKGKTSGRFWEETEGTDRGLRAFPESGQIKFLKAGALKRKIGTRKRH